MAAKIQKKDDFSFDFGGGPDDMSGWLTNGGFDGTGDINWNDIIGQQPENGSFVGPGGTDPNGLTGDDYNQLFDQAGQGLDENGNFKIPGLGGSGSGSGGLGSALSHIFGGNGDLSSLLPLLLPALASAYSAHSTNSAIDRARNDMLTGIGNANTAVQSAYDKSNGLFSPYVDAGKGALQNLQGMQGSNLAGQFNPLGSGRSLKSLGGR